MSSISPSSQIADLASAMSSARLQNELSIRTLKKVLTTQDQMARALLEIADVRTYDAFGQSSSPSGKGDRLDILA